MFSFSFQNILPLFIWGVGKWSIVPYSCEDQYYSRKTWVSILLHHSKSSPAICGFILFNVIVSTGAFRIVGWMFLLHTRLSFCRFNLDPSWSETGDRFMIKLFRDYVFHQVIQAALQSPFFLLINITFIGDGKWQALDGHGTYCTVS